MSKLRKIRNHRRGSAGRVPCESPFAQSQIDAIAQLYLEITVRLEQVKKKLLADCRKYGFTPKDAPKTKMLAGELYEVLASRATRTDVDQKKTAALNLRLTGWRKVRFLDCFETRVVFDLQEDWDRRLGRQGPGISTSRLRDLVTSCLTQRSSRRLTVRKKTSPSSHGVAKKSAPARAARKAA